MKAIGCALVLAACAGKAPETRYYQLAPPETPPRHGRLTLVLEPLATEPAYDDERIVYRTTPYRLDYYNYHRWSASPGVMIPGFLEQALERSGFRAVVHELSGDAPLTLGGRVIALEEVDAARGWVGRITLELTLTDTRTGTLVWTEQYDEIEPMQPRTPEGLARALSIALARIVARAAPKITAIAETKARQHAER